MTVRKSIPFKILNPNLKNIPAYATSLSAGFDLSAMLEKPYHLKPLERFLVPCGFSLAIPEGYEGQIRPRSGLAFKEGITVLNTPGTIDADYRGEIKVLLINLGEKTFSIEPHARIAQMIITPIIQASFRLSNDLSLTDRSDGGFGSTGI